MTETTEQAQEKSDRIGNALSIVLLLGLAALFIYGYAPRFIYSIFG